MKRRAFLALSGAAVAGSAALRVQAAEEAVQQPAGPPAAAGGAATVNTVRGSIDASSMGTTLVHEHVLVDFGGAATASRSRYDAEAVFRTALPHLTEVQKRGCRTLVECTPAYLGRDPQLLARLSEASGLQILTNTGYYGAANDVAIPKHAYDETPSQLAARWTAEFEAGIEGTRIRPGFVKIGVDAGPLSAIDRKLVEAGALTHLATGLTLAIHTGNGVAAHEILGVLGTNGVSPEAYVWVHAQNEADPASRGRAADEGAWVELDGVSPKSLDAHVAAVVDLRARKRLDRVLVSQDAGWYHVGEPDGGNYRSYAFLFDSFVPALRTAGLTEGEIRTLLVENPARAFAVKRRLLAKTRASG
ncbi:MAG: phosphotriesterase [Vicinamibacterales bacterium]